MAQGDEKISPIKILRYFLQRDECNVLFKLLKVSRYNKIEDTQERSLQCAYK